MRIVSHYGPPRSPQGARKRRRGYNQSMRVGREHRRRSIRIQGYDYSQAGAYYVTIGTQARACLFGEIHDGQMRLSEAGRVAETCWLAIPKHFPQAELGAFVVMPNHVHGIIILHDLAAAMISPPVGVGAQHAAPLPRRPRRPGVQPGSLGAIVRSYKAAVTHEIARQCGAASMIWQRNYYEHVIRNERIHQKVHGYIVANPLNWEIHDANRV